MTSSLHPRVDSHSTPATGETSRATHARKIYRIVAGQLFDPITRTLVANQVITVDGDSGVILDVTAQSEARTVANILGDIARSLRGDALRIPTAGQVDVVELDMGGMTILPGLVDVHVHLFLHPYAETSWEDQLTKESLAERTVRATVHARHTLLAGFTTVRLVLVPNLGTEGAFDADVGLRKCLAGRNAIIPGPRYYCVTRAIISTGAYGPKSSLYPAQDGIDGIKGAQPVDGVDDCVREVRRQIGAGADWIKIYADYSCRSRMSEVSSFIGTETIRTFNRQELEAMVEAAHARGVKVCAHATSATAVEALLGVGVDSIEHGCEIYDADSCDISLLRRFSKIHATTTWVPTLAAYATSSTTSAFAQHRWEKAQASFKAAMRLGMENIACGGDTGVFAHGKNALELVLMRRLGASWDRVLGWATYGGWRCVRGSEWENDSGRRRLAAIDINGFAGLLTTGFNPADNNALERGIPFGVIRAGWAADLVGVVGKLDGSVDDFEAALTTGVNFVMKGGRIYKIGGRETNN